MTNSTVRAVRDRIDPAELAGTLAIVAVLYGLGFDRTALGALVGIVIGVPVFEAAFNALDVGPASAGSAFGAVAVLAGVSLALGSGTDSWIGAGIAAIGCWVVLDAVYEHRHGDPTGAEPDGEISRAELHTLGAHGRWVIEALREADRPLTPDELRARTGLTEEELADVLEIARENETVERVGNGFLVNEDELGAVAFVRGIVRGAGRRILRPFRLFRPSR